ncbi:hypothetical protein [Papillibacter cinnamivorans]|uniref:Peptidase C39-like domain-containing protein n=1 Tax=Papillibacter cinnamivorans DSM 12816 TaxID=1122930 RepID=A0A1W2C422_9FIRM|nr:hypothetical protein [Papillibacter cinnamivorans]SMC79939.1 hypothetical protein SAMN02745168_2545 [Papillibacter cinnamivorans DSM 12816]
MIIRAISGLDRLRITDETGEACYYGCNQEWYRTKWQRLSGCGPSTFANILRYLDTKNDCAPTSLSRKRWEGFMEECWRFVTPTLKGVNTTELFRDGVLAYVRDKGLTLRTEALDIPKKAAFRPAFPEVLRFLEEALEKDTPVAFLNLHNGEEKRLDAWHWVTLISLEYEADGSAALAKILDESIVKEVDLRLWYDTTTLGGGFVRFLEDSPKPEELS